MKILLKVLFFSIIFTVLGFVYAPMQDSSSDAQKDEQAINAFKPTVHHKDWTSIVKSSKGKITSPILVKSKANAEALSKVNKIAIIAFNVSDWRGSDDMLNEFYDVLKQSFEKNGFSVLSANEIVNNEYYNNFQLEENNMRKLTGATNKYLQPFKQAYGLRPFYGGAIIEGMYKNTTKNLKTMQELAQALQVDAVLVVELNFTVKVGGKATILFSRGSNLNGMIIDMFYAGEPDEIWSGAVVENEKWKTEVKKKDSVDALAPYIKQYIEKYGELAARNMLINAKQ